MASGRPRYYRKVRGRAFWCPSKKMIEAGFAARPLGPDGPEAFKLAEMWNRRWLDYRLGKPVNLADAAENNLGPERSEELTIYPPRSIGQAFKEYRKLDAWRVDKKPKTREEWFRVWKHLKPVFGDVDPNSVSPKAIEAFRNTIRQQVSEREAHRVIKIWRALWRAMIALEFANKPDPSKLFANKAARGRSETWTEGEVVRLAKRAWREGFYGLAAIIPIAWDTQLMPGDVRALRASQMAIAAKGVVFFTERGKTGKPVGGALSRRSVFALTAYLDQIGVELMGEAPIFRNRSGRPYSKDTLGDDFRHIRQLEFGSGDRRTIGHDFRRSGAVEAIVGGASAEDLQAVMGNTIASSNSLYATYVPVSAASIRKATEARKRGRTTLR